jgi:poly-gamma-glutamate synthesis protein (capsule biosynthesis protein)
VYLPRRTWALVGLLVLALVALSSEGCTAAESGNTARRDGTPAEASLTLILAGDVILGRGVAQALDGDWEEAFAEVRPWLGDPPSPSGQSEARQVVLANLESPLTNLPYAGAGYDLRAPPEAVAALRPAGFDALSLANNHALDAGEGGLHETVQTLQAVGIVPWVEGMPVVLAQEPMVLGLSFDDSLAPLDVGAAAEAVAAAAEAGATVVVSIHWGGAYQAAPSARQQAIARALSEAGARVIAGHGPHVLQRLDWVGETLVAYSLGNLLFDQLYPEDCRWGAILRVTMRGLEIVSVEAIPTVTERGRVRRAEGEAAAAIADRLRQELAR